MQKTLRILVLITIVFILVLTREAFSQAADTGNAVKDNNSVVKSIKNFLGDQSKAVVLRFSSLGAWNYGGTTPSNPPLPLQQMNGKNVKITGFMYPLEEGQLITVFCLLRSTQTCCYGPKPQFNQYVFVEMKDQVKLERNKSVIVTGKFFIDPKPEDGYIYRLEGAKVEIAPEQKPDDKLSNLGAELQNMVFDFKALEAMSPTDEQLAKVNSVKDMPDIKTFPEALSKAEGKPVTVEGYIVARTDNPQKFVVGKYWWDGCCQGTPPSFFNAIVVVLKKGEKLPNEWQETSIFTGILHTNKDKNKWPETGIISLEDAMPGVSKK